MEITQIAPLKKKLFIVNDQKKKTFASMERCEEDIHGATHQWGDTSMERSEEVIHCERSSLALFCVFY